MKKILALLLSCTMFFCLVSCDDEDYYDDYEDDRGTESSSTSSNTNREDVVVLENYNDDAKISTVINSYVGTGTYSGVEDSDVEWVMYWYLCGSDLETYYGAATTDLEELMAIDLPSNVQVVIQTGGAEEWWNTSVSANKIERYLYSENGLELVDTQPSASMGDTDTLIDFLAFATENYPANHTMVNLWNHGGGSVAGVAFDENYDMDSLTLDELYIAFASVFEANPSNPPIDIIGFDACLMATIDTANACADFAEYLVASEEWEPGCGWNYYGFLGELADNPYMSALELGIIICDTYQEACEEEGSGDYVTLSVTDLTLLNNLLYAYDNLGNEALAYALDNTSFFTTLAKAADASENYGGNSRQEGYTNMVDLGDLAENLSSTLPETSQALLDALEDCVQYAVRGRYCPDSSGLSCYYPYSGDVDDYNSFVEIGAGDAFKYLYSYSLTGDLPDGDTSYLEEVEYVDTDTNDYSHGLPQITNVGMMGWEDAPLYVDENACAVLDLGPAAYDVLSSVTFELYYVDYREDIMLCLGSDNDIIADWEQGIFADNFRGVWGSIDGCLCYMELTYEGDGYNRYAVPVLLNGEKYNLSVVYDFDIEEWLVEGARKPLDDYGAADKNLVQIQVGDEIQTLHYGMTISGPDTDLVEVAVDTIIVTENSVFEETELGDGMFFWMYVMTDAQGNSVSSQIATFEIDGGNIYTSVD